MTTKKDLDLVFKVVKQLDDWIEQTSDAGSHPIANCQFSRFTCEISIGDIPVWDSENCDDDELTLEACRDYYVKQLQDFLPFLSHTQTTDNDHTDKAEDDSK